MLGSLPILPPRGPPHNDADTVLARQAHTLWSPTSSSAKYDARPPTPSSPRQQLQHSRRATHATHHARTELEQLNADERRNAAQNVRVQRFGSTWLRPPGVTKTLHAIMDEENERVEQEATVRREEAMAEEQAAVDAMARHAALNVVGAEMEEEIERDLDDDVPEAGAREEDVEDEDDQDGVEEDEGERDLDDDVQEGSSYEHTESDVEFSSFGDRIEVPQHWTMENLPSLARTRWTMLPVVPSAPRMSFESLHSGSADSSMFTSTSPIAAWPHGQRGTPRRGPDSTRRENTRPSSD